MAELFTEGATYSFKILNFVELDAAKFYVLESEKHTKIMMPYKYYQHYGFEVNQIIQCKVDKISCSAKVYFEPIHPIYKVGETYSFYLESQKIISEGAIKESVWMIKDSNGGQYRIPSIENFTFEKDKEVRCRLKRVKKGMCYFVPEVYFSLQYDTQRLHPFIVTGVYKNFDEDFLILKCLETDEKISLSTAKYANYDFQMGKVVNCRCVERDSISKVDFEPEHPYFKLGEIYPFHVSSIEDFPENLIKQLIYLIDIKGNRSKLLLSEPGDFKVGQKVNCVLTDIKNGKLIMEEQPLTDKA